MKKKNKEQILEEDIRIIHETTATGVALDLEWQEQDLFKASLESRHYEARYTIRAIGQRVNETAELLYLVDEYLDGHVSCEKFIKTARKKLKGDV